ncbi:MAG: hypothetical protein ABFQ65_03525 [Nanoarchaeota archaeon]
MKIEFTKNSKKDFSRLPVYIQSKFLESFIKLENNQLLDIKRMVGRGQQYRVRVGNYRAILEKEKHRWLIHFFGARGNVYLFF